MKRSLLAGLAGALLLLGAEHGQPWLAWLVCAPFAAAWPRRADRSSWRDGVAAGATFGLVAGVAGEALWMAEVGRTYFGMSIAVGYGAATALALACGLVFGSVLGIALQRCLTLPGGARLVGAASVWSTWETLLVIAFPYYPWVSLASTQHELASVLQAASLAGQAGLACLLAFTGLCVGRAIHGRPLRWLGAALAVALVTVGFGALRLHVAGRTSATTDGLARDDRCTIAAVDASIPSPAIGEEESLARYAARSEKTRALRPAVIVWPESALTRDPHLDDRLRTRLRAWAVAWQTELLVGAPRFAWSADWRPQQFNSMVLLPPAGALASYDKRLLVPFAESWPTRAIARPSWLATAEVSPGESEGLLRSGRCTLGVLICFEANRPGLARGLAAGGAQAIVIASNDAQLPRSVVVAQVAQAKLRAIETGLPVLRAANRGESAAIDRFGRIVDRSSGDVVWLTAGAPVPAPAVHWGNAARLALAVAALLSAALPGRRRP